MVVLYICLFCVVCNSLYSDILTFLPLVFHIPTVILECLAEISFYLFPHTHTLFLSNLKPEPAQNSHPFGEKKEKKTLTLCRILLFFYDSSSCPLAVFDKYHTLI